MKKFYFPLVLLLFFLLAAYGCNMDYRSKDSGTSQSNKESKNISEIEYLTSADIDVRAELRIDRDDSTVFTVSGDKREYSYYKFTKTGNTSNPSLADSSGINSAILARGGAELLVWDSLVITSGDHSHGIFSLGSGTSTTISDCVVITQAANSRAIVSTKNASVTLKHVTAETQGASSAALFADNSGVITARRGYYSTEGRNSPAVHSSSTVEISNAKIYSGMSNAAVIEANGSLSLTSCDVDSEYSPAVLIRHSSAEGTEENATLSVSKGKIQCGSTAVFLVNGTNADISLSSSRIVNENSDGSFLAAESANVNLTLSAQEIDGALTADDSSSLTVNLTDNSLFTGSVNNQSTKAKISVRISDAFWILTEDSNISSLTCSSNDIELNGYTLLVSGKEYTEGTAMNSVPEIPPLSFDTEAEYTTGTVNGVTYRAYNDIVYVAEPSAQDYQKLSIYIPEQYFNNATLNGYTASTAPIFMVNNSSGYMASRISAPSSSNPEGAALSHGLVVVSTALRGRNVTGGAAPASIVDYKAAVRYIRANKSRLPAGSTDRIIVCGVSSGGALSAVLGASGNSADFDEWLGELGAADASDEVFAVVSYCPVTNLDNADGAYEWVFGSEAYGTTSTELQEIFAEYVNSLSLMKDGQEILVSDDVSTFKNYIEGLYVDAAQKAIDSGTSISVNWLTVVDGVAVSADIGLYAESFRLRQKSVPAFDKFDLSSTENSAFGYKHFTLYSLNHSTAGGGMADSAVIYAMNPMNYIGQSDTAKFWRIRHGTNDRDITMNIPALLALKLENGGFNVDFAAVWGQGHGGYYDTEEMLTWVDGICK